MDLVLDNLGKLYSEHWIIRKLNTSISYGQRIGIHGRNGSGKSTLLRMILGLTLPTEGKVIYMTDDQELSRESWGLQISFAAPYANIFPEFTAGELLTHAQRFRPFLDDFDIDRILEVALLEDQSKKTLQQYSTGMLQRFKIALSICTKSKLLILDEPTSNLDEKGKEWFSDVLQNFLQGRTLLIASNEASDFTYCNLSIDLN